MLRVAAARFCFVTGVFFADFFLATGRVLWDLLRTALGFRFDAVRLRAVAVALPLRLAAVFLAAVFLAAVFLAAVFLAAVFMAAVFLAAGRFRAVCLVPRVRALAAGFCLRCVWVRGCFVM
ncbi:MAG TPA: hypothetical protein PKD61_28985 [Polyangiaceae bacterium]|nr:hypothetical protein [Polyangiaceae bacterium]